jgi:hypothetical protein
MEIKVNAFFDDDTKRMHRFLIETNPQGITGSIYVPKDRAVPDTVTISLRVKGGEEKEEGNVKSCT